MAAPTFKTQNDCAAVLTDEVMHDGWEHTIASTKSFYIRGATWFRNNVLMDVTNIREFLTELDVVVQETPGWRM